MLIASVKEVEDERSVPLTMITKAKAPKIPQSTLLLGLSESKSVDAPVKVEAPRI